MSTIKAVIYSILPCPHGWSLSTSFCDILKPIIVTTDEPASVTLFKASEIIDIEFETMPTINFNIESNIFTIIPVTLETIPYFPRTSMFFIFSLSFINKLINKLVIQTLFLFIYISFSIFTITSIIFSYFSSISINLL